MQPAGQVPARCAGALLGRSALVREAQWRHCFNMRRNITRPDLKVTNFHGILTVSDEMRELFALIDRVARSDASVLIRGETGTGKELVARALHACSPRKNGPFRALNCATLTPELLASELFGHVRGAFTGAVRDRKGLFLLGDGGTVFLDEIAEIPLDVQSRLLRVLQEHSFVPVGGTDPIEVDVRVISATNRALRRLVEQGRFREDLMYRVRVVPLFLPRLVERSGDVEALLWTFIDEFNARGLRQVEAIHPDAMDALLAYEWPGNVRELRNVVEYAFAVGEGPVLLPRDLTPEILGVPPDGNDLEVDEHDLERRRIVEALRKAGGRKTKAADLLGISRSTLWRKMREYRISASRSPR
ncbi:MAG: AAA family ATPase [Deltaproteobacteria bacterium]|nr:MAG: AAA family ATPase [Deltaproteobacteria bacterium]